jgi:4-hydroxy-tetrahydrodipicolinate synthase
MRNVSLRGATVALVTPFSASGTVDEKALRGLVDWQIQQGIDALLATGSTGEAATLAPDEQARVIEIVVEQTAGRRPVVAGTGTNSTGKSIEMTRRAEQLGCDAVMLVGPYYNKPTQDGFYEHFKTVADATSLPVVLYNVPGRTASNIAADTVLRLAEVPNIVAIKEASGNFSQIMQILRGRPKGFLLLSGDDAICLPLIALGADGGISVVANEAPGQFSRMIRFALDGQFKESRELHYRLLSLMELNFIESNPIPVKAALAMMGRIQEEYRLPLLKMTEPNRAKLRSVLLDLGLL